MTVGLGIDFVVIPLLIATICFAVILNRKLERLRHTGKEFQELMKNFQEVVAAAENSIERLKSAGTAGTGGAGMPASGAAALKEDLEFLVARGETLAEHLAERTRAGRVPAPARVVPGDVTRFTPAGGSSGADGPGDRELLKALEGAR